MFRSDMGGIGRDKECATLIGQAYSSIVSNAALVASRLHLRTTAAALIPAIMERSC